MNRENDIHDTSPEAAETPGIPDADNAADLDSPPKKRRFRPFGWVNGPARAIALAGLLVLVVLFGRDVFSSWHLRSEIAKLKQRKSELMKSLAADSIMLLRLDDPQFLERYARERYLMRKAGETVYIIEE